MKGSLSNPSSLHLSFPVLLPERSFRPPVVLIFFLFFFPSNTEVIMRSNSSPCRLDSSFNSLLNALFLSFVTKLTESSRRVTEAAVLGGVNDQLRV